MPNQRAITVDVAQERYAVRSAKASDVCRQLSFAGIATAWIFSGATKLLTGNVVIPSDLIWAGFFFVLALACDFLQYVAATLSWGLYSRLKELQVMAGRKSEPFVSPRQLNWGALTFFGLKIIALFVGYVILAVSLFHRIH